MSITIYCTKFQIRQARRLARWIFISTSKGIAKKSVQSSVIKTLWPPCLTGAMIWNTKLIWKKLLRLWSKVRGEDMSWEQAKQVNKYLLSRRRNMLMEVEGFLRDICISIALWLQGSLVRDTGLYRNLFGNFGSHRSLFLSKVSMFPISGLWTHQMPGLQWILLNVLQVLLCYESQGLLCKVNNKNVWQFLRFRFMQQFYFVTALSPSFLQNASFLGGDSEWREVMLDTSNFWKPLPASMFFPYVLNWDGYSQLE